MFCSRRISIIVHCSD